MISKRWTTLLATAALAVPMFARAEAGYDERFVREVGESLRAENQISRLARDNSHSDGVQHYAELSIGGQEKLLEELKDIAERHHYKFPEGMSSKQRDAYEHLKDLRSEQFDMEYMSGQVEDQKALVDMFEKAKDQAEEKNIREFADRKLASIKEHEQNAEELYRKVKHKEGK